MITLSFRPLSNLCVFLHRIIASHLTKLFDSIAALEFEGAKEPTGDKTALVMIAKDGERVELKQTASCTGPVGV